MSLIHNTKGDISPEYIKYIRWANKDKGFNLTWRQRIRLACSVCRIIIHGHTAHHPKNLTNTQHDFAEWLIENKHMTAKIGNMEDIFNSVRKYLRNDRQRT